MIPYKKLRWPFFFVLLLSAGFFYAFWPRAVEADLETVSAGPLVVSVDDDAITRIREIFTITAPVTGRIQRVNIHAGDTVIAGKTIVVSLLPGTPALHDVRSQRELEAGLRAAQEARNAAFSQVEGARAELDYAKIEFDRANLLFKNNATAAKTVDQTRQVLRSAQAAVSTAQSILQQRESELKKAEAALLGPEDETGGKAGCCLNVVAPESGVVLKVFQENEMVVALGAPLMDIGDTSQLEIVANPLSEDALKISAGDPVLVENWGGDVALHGKVRLVEPAGITKTSSLGIEEQRVNVLIDLTDPPAAWKRLGHGYKVDVRIIIWQSDHVLRVPIASLFRQGKEWAVFCSENGRARIRTIKIGHMGTRYAEVLEGLAEGSAVILHPSDKIAEGVRIRPRKR